MDNELAFQEGKAAYDADDHPRAAALLLPLAEAGHAEAQYLMADMYRHGKGVGEDPIVTIRFYRAAADQGHPRAALFLSFVLDPNGKSAPPAMNSIAKDPVQAKRYLDLAFARNLQLAEAGDLRAMCDLGFLYHLGIGTERNGAEAIRWYTRAFEAGGWGAAMGLSIVYCDGDEGVRDPAKATFWQAKYLESRDRGTAAVEKRGLPPNRDNPG